MLLSFSASSASSAVKFDNAQTMEKEDDPKRTKPSHL